MAATGWSAVLLRLLLVVQPLMLSAAAAVVTPTAETATATTGETATTAEASTQFLVMTHEESTLTSITVSWTENSTEPSATAATAATGWYRVEALNLNTRFPFRLSYCKSLMQRSSKI